MSKNSAKKKGKKEKITIAKVFALHTNTNTISWRSLKILRLNLILYGTLGKLSLLFNNNDKVCHYSCVICRGVCSCEVDYTGMNMKMVKRKTQNDVNI